MAEQHRFDGWRKGSFLALSLFGNQAIMLLESGSESWKETHVIEVDYIEIETADDSRRQLQSGSCPNDGFDDFNEGNVKNTECSHGLGSGADENIKSVVKIIISTPTGSSVGTGFFFGAYNRILTNKHVLENPEDAKDAEIEIQFECTSCNGHAVSCAHKQVYKVAVRSLLWSDDALDAASLNLDYDLSDDLPINIVAPFDEITSNYFPAPVVGEHIYIVHHPSGQPKKITHDDNGIPCQIISFSTARVYTNCDTIGGSSGAPVFRASDHKLIALHRASLRDYSTTLQDLQSNTVLENNECAQVGSRMDMVWAKMKQTQFKCCATFATHLYGFGDRWRICDDVPHVPVSFNDEFTSVKVTDDCKVTTYKDEHFDGGLKSWTGTSSSPSWQNMVSSGWNDKVSSMRFRRTDSGKCRVRFYYNTNYGGNWVEFTGDQAVLYKWNDVWSSFKLYGSGCKLILYRDEHFRNLIGTYESNQSSIAANNQVSSFRIIPSSDQCDVKLFKSTDCTGTWKKEESDKSSFSSSWNDAVRSARISSGCGLILYQDDDFGGGYEHFEGSHGATGNCHDLDWGEGLFHNQASSLKLYKIARQINRRLLQIQE